MCVGQSKRRIKRRRLLIKLFRSDVVFSRGGDHAFTFERFQIKHVGIRILGRLSLETRFFFWLELRLESSRYLSGQLTLDAHRIGDGAIITLRPDMPIMTRVD